MGQKLTVIAWLWARTVKSPNPAFAQVDVPLASTFMLSTKPGKEAYVEPVIEGGGYRFTVKVGKPKDAEAAKNGTKLSRGELPVPDVGSADRVRVHRGRGQGGSHGCAADGDCRRGRAWAGLSATDRGDGGRRARGEADVEARCSDAEAHGQAMLSGRRYGFRTFGDYFTPRQLWP